MNTPTTNTENTVGRRRRRRSASRLRTEPRPVPEPTPVYHRKHDRSELLSAVELSVRGWTPAMIRDMLGEPDDTRPNPYAPSTGRRMRLWLISRADEVEASPDFAERIEAARRRSAAGRRAAEARTAELVEEVSKIKFTVQEMSIEEATALAISSFNARGALRSRGNWFEAATPDSAPEFLERITVNFLRHECTRYDEHWHALAGRVGKDEAYDLIRERVVDEIAEVYPDLSSECSRQQR